MKPNLNVIFFLDSADRREASSLSKPTAVNKKRYDRKMAMTSHQLLYKSIADDVFWVLHSKIQGKRQSKCLF